MKALIRRLWNLPEWLKLILFAGLLRIPNLGIERLWFDETYTAWQARPTTDLWAAVLGDVHPPLWPLIEAINERLFGFSEFMFRLPAALFGIGAVLLIWRIGLALKFPRRTAFTAGLLAAILPAGVYFAQDARMYAALTFFVLLALLGAIRRNWLIMVLGGIGAVYTHNAGLLYIAAIGSAVLLPSLLKRQRALVPLLTFAGIAAAWAPWGAIALPQQLAMVKADYWVPSLSLPGVLMPYLETTIGWRIAHSLQIPAYFAVIAATLVGLINARRWIMRNGLPLLAVVFGGPALLAAVSMLWKSVYVFRPIVPASMALTLLWAYALNHLALPNRLAARAVLLPALFAGLVAHYTLGPREDLAQWVQVVRAQWRPGDVILHTDRTTLINYGWYLQDLPQGSLPGPGSVITVTDSAQRAMRLQQVAIGDLLPGVYHRFWLIYSPNPYTTQREVDEVNSLKVQYSMNLIAYKSSGTKYFQDMIYLGEFQ